MKKLMIGMLIGTSIMFSGCGNKLQAYKPNSKDSTQVKQAKELFNEDYALYEDKTKGEMLDYMIKEAKVHPKDKIMGLGIRCFLNYIDYSNDPEGEKNVRMMKGLLAMGSKDSNCKESEYKDAKKIKSEDLNKEKNYTKNVKALYKSDKELVKLNEPFVNADKSLGELLNNKTMTAEEFLKKDPKKVYDETVEKRKTALLEMQKQIDKMK